MLKTNIICKTQEEDNFAWYVLYDIMYREQPEIFSQPAPIPLSPQPSIVLHHFPIFPILDPMLRSPPSLIPAPDIVHSSVNLDLNNEIFWLENDEDFLDLRFVSDELL